MNYIEGTKTSAKVTVAVQTNGTHSHEIDTYGVDYVSVDVVYSTFSAATSAYASVLKVQQSDTAGSGQTDLSGFTVSTTGNAGATTGNAGAVCRFNIDCRGKKRYLTVVTTPGNPATVATVARLAKGEDLPVDRTSAGVNTFVSG